MRLKLNVAKGYQVSLATVDYRGYAALEQGSSGQLHSWYLTYGKRWAGVGSSRTTRFTGPSEEDFFRRDELRGPERHRWSPCGGEVTVDLYAHLLATSRRNSQAFIQVDAADGAAEFRYGMDVRKCK